jgi:hypothetical protein
MSTAPRYDAATRTLARSGSSHSLLQCVPQHRPTLDAESVEYMRIKNRPKVGLINEQVRGELAGQKSNETTDSIAIASRIHAPRQAVVNEQVRVYSCVCAATV